jgi:hypothetical protein
MCDYFDDPKPSETDPVLDPDHFPIGNGLFVFSFVIVTDAIFFFFSFVLLVIICALYDLCDDQFCNLLPQIQDPYPVVLI